jgi:hypothetical protein
MRCATTPAPRATGEAAGARGTCCTPRSRCILHKYLLSACLGSGSSSGKLWVV